VNEISDLQKIDTFQLKLIALISMLIDHIAAVVLLPLLRASGQIVSVTGSFGFRETLLLHLFEHQQQWIAVYEIMRIIGRLAFPLYCFLLVQGFTLTHSRKKYAARLLGFVFLSELPFDLALTGRWISPDSTNVFLTLFLGFISLWMFSRFEEFRKRTAEMPGLIWKNILAWIAAISTLCGICYLADLLHSDYGAAGVITILILYLLRRTPCFAQLAGVILLSVLLDSVIEYYAVFSVVPVFFYNYKRGRPIKYLFYLFYPLHLLLLYGITILLTAV